MRFPARPRRAPTEKSRIYLRDVPDEAQTLIWEIQVQALAPLAAAGKLGCMLFYQVRVAQPDKS